MTPLNIKDVNYEKLIEEIANDISTYREQGKKIFASSSFQPQSIVMLHILSEIDRSIPVYFMDTGYHFQETIDFRNDIEQKFGLNIIDLRSHIPSNEQVDELGRPLYESNPDHCCHINKVAPLESILTQYDVWINGVRKTQTANRAKMKKEEVGRQGILRYHPILEWDSKMIFKYINEHNLPVHSLVPKGYFSVGCTHCTAKADPSKSLDDRSGRWAGKAKTECGLHL